MEHSPLDLFPLYFSPAAVEELCHNTNKYAAKHTAEKSYAWQDVDVDEFYRFLGLVLVKLPSVQDYLRRGSTGSVPFPGTIMTHTRFESLLGNLHLTDVEKDQENDRKKAGLSMTTCSAFGHS